jgi:D-alanyl-lipoteichoic acid acyltransferase DltB (MBOAT superfamily)
MLFPTVTFAVFFVAVFAAHLALRDRPRAWKWAMLAASYVFYGWWDWRFCGLIAASTGANWAFGSAVDGAPYRRRRTIVGISVLTNLLVLGTFKYYGFFVEAVSSGFGSDRSLPALNLVLPIGISFFTFQALSYVVDIHRGKLHGRSLLDFAVYLAFFPQLVAGPIVRATEFLPQLDRLTDRKDQASPVAHHPIEVSEAAWLIARGLFKKVVIASYLADSVVDTTFAAPSLASRTELLLAFYGYAVQIYADFSGYTDMAIGAALLLGFRFPTNFDNPYRALSVQDFWRRWHMTLSRWLRDYLYIPLGGNKISPLATYRNLMATMILGGLWHGAAWTFVAWGTIHGLALAIERLVGNWRQGAPGRNRVRAGDPGEGGEARVAPAEGAWTRLLPLVPVARWVVTFHLVGLAWVLFRAETFGLAWDFFTGLVSAPFGSLPDPLATIVIAVAIAAQVAPPAIGTRLQLAYARMDPALQSIGLGGWIFLVARLGPEGVAPFIYFQF